MWEREREREREETQREREINKEIERKRVIKRERERKWERDREIEVEREKVREKEGWSKGERKETKENGKSHWETQRLRDWVSGREKKQRWRGQNRMAEFDQERVDGR